MIGHRVEVQGMKPERGGSSVCLIHTAASVFYILVYLFGLKFSKLIDFHPDQIERTASSWKSGALQSLLGSANTCGKSAIDIAI
jgi:hypothetical protein